MSKTRIEIILGNTPFPGAGQEIGGYRVNESAVDIKGKNWAIYLQGKLSPAQVKTALSSLTGKHFALPVQDEFSLIRFDSKGMTHARTNPPGDVTVVRGHMYYARPNPISSKDFQSEMNEMLIDDPEKFFTKYTVRNKDELHERLWKGVSYAGESYGWKRGNELYHRRASFIMPKIKINKALKGATMFYHTHPAKDEPSLTSADDIQFYLDLHFAYGIKSFYTIMKHKLDHFTITGKPGGKEKYLRMEEDAFIDTVDGMIADGEKVAKKEVGVDKPEIEFQNKITKEMVNSFNTKYKSIANISFRAKSKNPASKLAKHSSFNPIAALSNPAPNPPIRVQDEYIAKALDELKGLDYAHEHYGADEYGHTMYVYWWLKHHLAPTPKQPKGRLWKLNEFGMDSETRKKVREYLSQPIIGNYTYMDAVYLMALYHDIAKLREKGAQQSGWEIGAEMFRSEIGPELGLPSKLTEDIAFLFDTDLGRKGITDKDFMTQSGDYYGSAKLVQMSDMITHHPTMYKGGDVLKQELMVNMVSQLKDFVDHHYVIQNPPPKPVFVKWVADYSIGDLVYEEVEELLGEFHQSVIPDENGKTKQDSDKSSGGHLYFMRFNSSVLPGLSRFYTANFALSSSKILINIGRPVPDDLGKKDATLIYEAVGRRLQDSYPEVEIEEVEPEPIVNPRKANKIQVISLSGPSGGGKSTVMRYLNKNIPNSSTPPTYTTRPRRPTDGKDRVFVSKTQFKEMLAQGQFVEYTVSANGHYYGRRFKDFRGNVAIIEVSLDGKKHYEKRFANPFTVYLDPDPSLTEEERAKAIYRRGGLTKEEAKRRAKNATETVARSKKMQFDLRVTMIRGKYNDAAKKVLSQIPLTNPVVRPRVLPTPLQAVNIARDERGEAPITADEYIRNARQQAAEAAQAKFYGDTRDINQWNREQPALLAGAPSLRPFEGLATELTHRAPGAYNDPRHRREKYGLARVIDPNQQTLPFSNPKDLFDWFEDWAKLINMKNKELKTFLDSDWGKVAGLSPQEAKKLGINSGRTSGRRILKMREKLGLGGPKDYIKGPRHLEDMYATAIDKWTGPATKKGTDWYWCTRQVRFNKRFMGDNFGERKGPLVKKQKTQNQPSRRLLSLWVWGHDPWRYARKNGVNRMPKCPSVPWVGMTEKRKYGVIEVIPGPKNNPTQKKECPLPPKKGIIIYGAKWCKWCNEARKYLDEKNKKYDYVDIDTVKNYQKNIFPLTDNYPYIPVIFIDGKFIGGYSELVARKNPKVRVKKDKYRSYFVNEEGYDLTSIPFDGVELSEDEYMITLGEPMERAESIAPRRGNWHRIGMAAYDGKKSIIEVAPATMLGDTAVEGRFHGIGSHFQTRHSIFFKNFYSDAPVFPTVLTHMKSEPSAILLVQGSLVMKGEPEMRTDVTDWKGESKGGAVPVYEVGTIRAIDVTRNIVTFKPDGRFMVMEAHDHNLTKNKVVNSWTVRIEDKGEYLWLEEIQVHPEKRGEGLLRDALWYLLFEMPYRRVPEYPEKKPIRTLARVVDGIPQEVLVKTLKRIGFKELEKVDGGVLMELQIEDYKSPFSNPGNKHIAELVAKKNPSQKFLDGEASTLVFVKPLGLNAWLDIKRMLPGAILRKQWVRVDKELISQHYAEHSQKPHFSRLVNYYEGQWVLALVVGARFDAVRAIIGSSKPDQLKEGDIRKAILDKYGDSSISLIEDWTNGVDNGIHASDSVEAANQELKLWFDRPVPPTPKFLNLSSHAAGAENDDNFHPFAGLTLPIGDWTKCAEVVVDFFEGLPWLPGWVSGKNTPPMIISGTAVLVALVLYTYRALIGKDPTIQGANPFGQDDFLPEEQRLILSRLVEDLRRRRPALANPKAPGYNSYAWTTQDWRSIKVNSKGDIDYSEKCGAEGTRTKSGKPRLCLAAPIIRSLMKTESGKEVLRQQARKKLRAKKGERVPWHPRIKKLHKKLEERTPEDR